MSSLPSCKAQPVPGGARYLLPYGTPSPRDVPLLEQMQEHLDKLRQALFFQFVADHFPKGIQAVALSVDLQAQDGETYLDISATGYICHAGKPWEEVDLAPEFAMAVQDQTYPGAAFREFLVECLRAHPNPLTPAQFRQLAGQVWTPREKASADAAMLDQALASPVPSRPRPRA